VNLTGENSTKWLGWNLFFPDCYFSAGDVLFKNVYYPIFWGTTKFSCSTLKFSNCMGVFMGPGTEVGSAVTTFTVETDQTSGVKTPTGWTTGTKLIMQGGLSSKDITWSLINITTWTGTAVQIRSSRFGSAGNTIPANAQVLAYNSTLVGNYTIASGGILSLYGSPITGTLTKNGTLNLYQPASQTKNDSTVSGTTVKDALETLKAADMPAPTALSDVLVAAGSPLVWTKVSLAEFKVILGI
jgi:hypothetical protein